MTVRKRTVASWILMTRATCSRLIHALALGRKDHLWMIRKVRTYKYWTYGVKLMRHDSSMVQAAKVHAWLVVHLFWRGREAPLNYERRSLSCRASVFYRQRYCAVELLDQSPWACHSSFTGPIWTNRPLPTSHISMASPFPCLKFVCFCLLINHSWVPLLNCSASIEIGSMIRNLMNRLITNLWRLNSRSRYNNCPVYVSTFFRLALKSPPQYT